MLHVSTSEKKLFLVHEKTLHLMDPVQHQNAFSKDLLGKFWQLQPFQVEMYLFFPPKSPTELTALADIFGVSREEFFRPTFIRLNLATALSRS